MSPSPQATNPGPLTPSAGRRVLVIEDHADTALMMQRILRTDGHIVDIANSLGAAEGLCHGQQYQLLITDLELPDGLAFDLIAPGRIAHGIPAIVISGHGMPSHIDRSRQAGFKEHLVKPFSILQLREAIARTFRD